MFIQRTATNGLAAIVGKRAVLGVAGDWKLSYFFRSVSAQFRAPSAVAGKSGTDSCVEREASSGRRGAAHHKVRARPARLCAVREVSARGVQLAAESWGVIFVLSKLGALNHTSEASVDPVSRWVRSVRLLDFGDSPGDCGFYEIPLALRQLIPCRCNSHLHLPGFLDWAVPALVLWDRVQDFSGLRRVLD